MASFHSSSPISEESDLPSLEASVRASHKEACTRRKSGDRVGALAMIKDVKEQMRRIEELRCGKEESNLDMKEDDTLERRSEMPRGCYDWERHETDEGEYYYYNVVTDVTTWDKPADFIEETLTTVRRIKRRETVATCSRGAIGLGFGLDNGKITTVESASRTRSSTVGEKSSLESSNSSPFGKVKNIFNKRKQKRMSMPAIINEREGGISNTSGMDADDFTLARQRAGSRYKESSSGIIEEADEDEDEHAGVTRLKSPSVILIDDEIMGDDTAADLGKKVSLSSSGVSFEKAAKNDTASDGEAIVLGSRRSTKWKRVRVATFGDGTGADNENQIYFENRESGQTQWERPDDYFSSDDEAISGHEHHADHVDIKTQEAFDEVDIFNFDRRNDFEFIYQKLNELSALVQSVGTEEEWKLLIEQTNYKLPRHIFGCLIRGVDLSSGEEPEGGVNHGLSEKDEVLLASIRTIAAQNMILFSKLDSSVWVLIIDYFDESHLTNFFNLLPKCLMNAIHGPPKSFSDGVDVEQEQLIWLMLIEDAFFYCNGNSKLGELDSCDMKAICDALFECLEVAAQDCFLQCGKSLVAFNLQFSSAIVQKCSQKGTMASHLCEVVLHLLNEEAYGEKYNPQAALNALKVFEGLLATTDTSECVYTNDVNVLIDVIIREVSNLPPLAELRASYLNVLHLLLLNSEWGINGRHKRKEIYAMIKDVSGQGKEAMGVHCIVAVEDLLEDCLDMLEP